MRGYYGVENSCRELVFDNWTKIINFFNSQNNLNFFNVDLLNRFKLFLLLQHIFFFVFLIEACLFFFFSTKRFWCIFTLYKDLLLIVMFVIGTILLGSITMFTILLIAQSFYLNLSSKLLGNMTILLNCFENTINEILQDQVNSLDYVYTSFRTSLFLEVLCIISLFLYSWYSIKIMPPFIDRVKFHNKFGHDKTEVEEKKHISTISYQNLYQDTMEM